MYNKQVLHSYLIILLQLHSDQSTLMRWGECELSVRILSDYSKWPKTLDLGSYKTQRDATAPYMRHSIVSGVNSVQPASPDIT